MILELPEEISRRIHTQGESAYPEEVAGLLLGVVNGACRRVVEILPLPNVREDAARHNRYLLSPQDYLKGEQEAMHLGLDVVGIFHSHPDHPSRPSEFDRQWAWPNFSYLITSVMKRKAIESRSWRLAEDRSKFLEERIKFIELKSKIGNSSA
jgi:proteasome lid subunit RPN8/RPN11